MTDNELNELFRALGQSDSGTLDQASEDRLRLAFRARQTPQHARRYLLEIAASVLVALGLYFLSAGGNSVPLERLGKSDITGVSQFVLLPYGQSDVPLEHPVIVRIQVPEGELSRLGVSLPAIPKNARVEADLLVGQDGIARAVRVNRHF
jgi:hypothetical protein